MAKGKSREELMKISKGTQFSSTRQPDNYRGKSIDTLIKEKLYDPTGYMDFREVYELDEEGNPTGKKVNCRIFMGNLDAIILMQINKARKGDQKATEYLINRVAGRPKQTIEHKTDMDQTEEGLMTMIKKHEESLSLLSDGRRSTSDGITIEISESEAQTDKGIEE
jgi:hypothetical protein